MGHISDYFSKHIILEKEQKACFLRKVPDEKINQMLKD
jgi:hypothetical protein